MVVRLQGHGLVFSPTGPSGRAARSSGALHALAGIQPSGYSLILPRLHFR